MAVTQDKPAPYAPASAILEIINRYRNRGLIFPVTGEVLARAGISESLIPRTLQAIQTLDLFGADGNPTATMEAIRLAPEPEYEKRLEDWLKSAYADVFAFVDPTIDGEIRIRDAFRGYNPIGQQERMVTLFQGLCTAAGLAPEKQAPASKPSAPRSAPRAPIRRARNAPPQQLNKSAAARVNAYGLPPAIAGLVESLPPPEQGWTTAERDKFLTTFEAVLDFAIPVVQQKSTSNADE
jgi:hypothetical protein